MGIRDNELQEMTKKLKESVHRIRFATHGFELSYENSVNGRHDMRKQVCVSYVCISAVKHTQPLFEHGNRLGVFA